MQIIAPNDKDVQFYTAAGAEIRQESGLLTLANATTYYAEVGGPGTGLSSVQWAWAAALVATITYESTNLPGGEASVFVAAGALWFPETGPGTLTIPGGSASTVMHHFNTFGARRMRAKIVVTTGGTAQLRGRAHSKAGS